jgi:Phosphotransferase enzyme family
MPSERVLRWAAEAVHGTRVLSAEDLSRSYHRGSGTFRLRIEGSYGATAAILKVPVPRWIDDRMVITNAQALRVAETHDLAAPRLIAADLDGRASGTVATLETFLSASTDLPRTVSVARLREAGAAIARVHAFFVDSQPYLPYRPRPCAVDDRAAERRRGRMPTLLHEADERVRSHGVPAADSVFLHGDVWGGNMLWDGDRCVALVDWKTAGAGDPGVDLGSLRMQMAIQFGEDAPPHVLEGWQRQAGRAAIAVPYWDAVAALNTPTVMDPGDWPGFTSDGSPLDAAAVTGRRDAFLRTALDQLPGSK